MHQTALQRQDLSCMCLAHRELGSFSIIIVIIIIMNASWCVQYT